VETTSLRESRARLAIASTARSERRIAIRPPEVGIDASCASADPAPFPAVVTLLMRLLGAGMVTVSIMLTTSGCLFYETFNITL
jgi:hypothetical protein